MSDAEPLPKSSVWRLEVVCRGPGRRRAWRAEQKAGIIAVCAAARRHELMPATGCRREARRRAEGAVESGSGVASRR